MRRNLLILVSLFVSSVAFAQGWEKPVYSGDFQELTPGDTCYLYNDDAKAFFTEGNAWGTQASIGETGLPVCIERYVVDNDWDGKSYLIKVGSVAKNSWNVLFCTKDSRAGGEAAFVDGAADKPDRFWQFEAKGDMKYHISIGDLNATYNHEAYPGVLMGIDTESEEHATVADPFCDVTTFGEAMYHLNWKFARRADYDRFALDMQRYQAAVALGEALDKAEEECPGINLEDEAAVYNNLESTLEELKNATDAVAKKVNDWKEQQATPDNPSDMTELFDASNFDNEQIGSWKNTTGAQNHGAGGTAGKLGNQTNFLENWHPSPFSGTIYYDLNELPNGIYEFSLDPAYNGGEGYVYAGTAKTYGNNMNFGETYSALASVTEGKLQVGMEIINRSSNWVGIDNAVLKYFGNSDDSYKFWCGKVIEEGISFDEGEGNYAERTLIDAYEAAIQELEGKETRDDILAYMPTYQAALDAVMVSYEAYKKYQEAMEDVEKALDDEGLYGKTADELADYLATYEDDIMKPGEMTAEEIAQETERVKALLTKAREESIKPGSDVTSLITNPNFTKKGEGWTIDPNYAEPAFGGTAGNPCAEKWNDNFNIYQDITLPNGVYKLQVQGFYRPLDNTVQSFTNYMDDPTQDEVLAFIYANKSEKAIQNIGKHCYSENLENNCSSTTWEGSTVYIVNGLSSASAAFSRGDYDNEVYGIVTDGTLRVGIKSTTGTIGGRWTLWDNFRLTFLAKDADAINAILPELIRESKEIYESADQIGTGEKEALGTAITDAEKLLNTTDGDKLFDAYVALENAKQNALDCIDAYAKLAEARTSLENAINEYQETADPLKLQQAAGLLDEIDAALGDGTYNTEEALAKVDEVNATITQLQIPAEPATDDNPLDLTSLIKNPTFDDGDLSGWEGTAWGRGGTVADGAEHYNMKFDTYQEIVGLTPGTYGVGVQAFYRRGWAEDDFALYNSEDPNAHDNVVLYAVGTEEYQTPIAAPSSKVLSSEEITEIGVTPGLCKEVEQGRYIPDTMLAADGWFNILGAYKNIVYVNVDESGRLRFGAKFIGQDLLAGDWSLYDNWTLEYYGTESKHNPVTAIDKVDVNGQKTMVNGIYDLSGRRVGADYKGIVIVNGKKVLVK